MPAPSLRLITGLFLLAPLAPGAPSPAGTFCQDQGGETVLLYDRHMASVEDLCQFGNGLVESWTFLRYRHGRPQQAVRTYLDSLAPSPGLITDAVCTEVGAQAIHFQDISRNPVAVCHFQDGSEIELRTLSWGPAHTRELAEALRR